MARNAYDFYPTPAWAYENLPIDWSLFATALEPCEGDGRITRFLQEKGVQTEGFDLQTGTDYLTSEPEEIYDLILTNPPYSLALEFLDKALQDAETVIMLLRINFLGSQKRYEWFKNHEPSSMYVLSKRPSFTGSGTDSTEYAWVVWDSANKLTKGISHVL